MVNTEYTLYVSGKDPITIDYNTADVTVTTRGETATFELWPLIETRDDLTVSGTYTVSSDETWGTVTIESGATLVIESGAELTASTVDNDGTIDNDGTLTIDGFSGTANVLSILQNLGDYAGKFTITETLNSGQKFREFLPSSADIGSLVIGIQPNTELSDKTVPGFWGLVDSVSDPRNKPLNTTRYSLTIRILGEYSEYSDITDVKNDLEV